MDTGPQHRVQHANGVIIASRGKKCYEEVGDKLRGSYGEVSNITGKLRENCSRGIWPYNAANTSYLLLVCFSVLIH